MSRAAAITAAQFRVPPEDAAELYRLPETERHRLRDILPALRRIHEASSTIAACQRLAHEYRHQGRGWSRQSLYRQYRAYIRTRDWRTLVRNYRAPEDPIPPAFIQHWKALCERNQRKCKPAYRALIAQWHAWCSGSEDDAIPGYATPPPPADCADHPKGWSYTNLMRHAPGGYELTAARLGRSAAATKRPLVFTTRAGLAVGEYYLFDDMWHDHKVTVPGQRRAMRPLEFHCLDLFSACKIKWGIKPMLENSDGTTTRLKEREMLVVLVTVLTDCGYRPQGTTLVVEHGTAAIRPDIEEILVELTGGAVKVERGGIQSTEAFTGQYAGAGKGNYRFKAALESLGNLIHNEMAFLPGQTGKDRDHCPAELHGREKHANALIAAIAALPPETAARLRLPFIDHITFENFASRVYERINNRTDHNLEGWEQAGLVTGEWRLDPSQPWLPAAKLLELPADTRQVAEALLAKPGHCRQRNMSPAEVWATGRGHLKTLPRAAGAKLLARYYGKERKVGDDHLIAFEDAEAGPGCHRFLARVRDEHGRDTILRPGEKFLAVHNPLSSDQLDLFDAKGRHVGSCPRWGTPARNDTDGIHARLGAAAREEANLLKPLALRGSEILRQRLADTEHNNNLLNPDRDPAADTRRADAEKRLRRAARREAPGEEHTVENFARIASDDPGHTDTPAEIDISTLAEDPAW